MYLSVAAQVPAIVRPRLHRSVRFHVLCRGSIFSPASRRHESSAISPLSQLCRQCGFVAWIVRLAAALSATTVPAITAFVLSDVVAPDRPDRCVILVDIANSGTTKGYTLGNGTWYTTAIPYLRPTDIDGGIAFDLMPNTATTTVWEDICSTDIVIDSNDYE